VKVIPRRKMPDIRELVVGTVEEIHDFGAYLSLDEYGGMRAFLPWSEIATRMVRNIRQVLREGQKVVVKVIRLYKSRGQVDVSLKRVASGERRRKMMWWKRTLKASSIVLMVGERIGKSEEEAFKEVVWKLDDYYGDPLTGLEQALIYGPDALKEAGVPEEWVEPLLEESKLRVTVRQVRISGVFTLQSKASDGVNAVRSVLKTIEDRVLSKADGQIKVRIYTIGAPKYRIDLISHDYKIIEKALEDALRSGEKLARKLGVSFSFERLRA